jgi:hypothetical protein
MPGQTHNAIQYSLDVPLTTLQLAAYALIRAGVELRSIAPALGANPPGTIRVVASPLYVTLPAKTVPEIAGLVARPVEVHPLFRTVTDQFDDLGLPIANAGPEPVNIQQFEKGFMLWRQGMGEFLYVFASDADDDVALGGTWQRYSNFGLPPYEGPELEGAEPAEGQAPAPRNETTEAHFLRSGGFLSLWCLGPTPSLATTAFVFDSCGHTLERQIGWPLHAEFPPDTTVAPCCEKALRQHERRLVQDLQHGFLYAPFPGWDPDTRDYPDPLQPDDVTRVLVVTHTTGEPRDHADGERGVWHIQSEPVPAAGALASAEGVER